LQKKMATRALMWLRCACPPDTSRMSICGRDRVYYGSIRRIENLPFRRESPESWAITKHEACDCAGRGAVLLLAWLGHRGWGLGIIGGLGLEALGL